MIPGHDSSGCHCNPTGAVDLKAGSGSDQVRRALQGPARDDLLAPVNDLVELSGLLVREASDRDNEEFQDDLRKVHEAAGQLRHLVKAILDGRELPNSASLVTDSVSWLRHELRGPLNQIIGYSELWLEDAEEYFLEGLAADLARVRDLGRHLLGRIDELLRLGGIAGCEAAPATAPTGLEPTPTPAPTSTPGRLALTIELTRQPPGTLLVADDHEANRDLLARFLERLGHRVVPAESGRRVLELVAEQSFDLILLDVLMPEMDGFQALRHLKANPATRSIPVIMITSLDELEGAVHGIQLGAEDYLTKPFNQVLLQARVGACLEKKRLHDRLEHERQRYDELLHDILPSEVVAELKQSRTFRPYRSEDVAILFADLVGFTSYCDRHPPEAVVCDLQRLVDAWDTIAPEHGVEKIKTIGDAYMAARGLLRPAVDPIGDCIACGRAMIAATRNLNPEWDVRVGVHIGPVVAGVLGRRQYLFDVWGDTVNCAARAESHGLPGRVNLSESAYLRVADRFPGLVGRAVDAKGKGRIVLYAV